MKELVRAARALEAEGRRKGVGGKNLWCVVALDGGARVWSFGSGKGFEGIAVDRGVNRDAEERMSLHFDNMVAEHGQSPGSVQMITRATPCNRLCTGLIRHLAARYPTIAMITIASWADYHTQSEADLARSKELLNGIFVADNFDVEIRLINGKNITWESMMPTPAEEEVD